MPLMPPRTVDARWDEVVTRWEAAARAVTAPGGDARPAGPPSEEQAYRVLQAVRALAVAGAEPVDRIADAFEERDDVADALLQLRETWGDLRQHVEEAVEPA